MTANNQTDTQPQRRDRIEGIHRLPLFGALAVAVFTLVVVGHAQWNDSGKVGRTIGVAVEERDLLFRDGANGTVIVRDAKTGDVLERYGRGEGAFIRQSMRAMTYNRHQNAVDLGKPYKLVRTASGKLSIVDPITGKFIKLNAFGKVAMDGYMALLHTVRGSAKAAATPESGA